MTKPTIRLAASGWFARKWGINTGNRNPYTGAHIPDPRGLPPLIWLYVGPFPTPEEAFHHAKG